MKTEMSEYLVGACLKLLKGCAIVDHNIHCPVGGVKCQML